MSKFILTKIPKNKGIQDDLDFLFNDPSEIYQLLTKLNQFYGHDESPLTSNDVQNLERLRSLFLNADKLK